MQRKPNLSLTDFPRISFPIDVVVETSGYCNLRCIVCPYSTLKRKKGEMDFEIFKKIADEIAEESPSSRLWVAFMGEPLLRGDSLVAMLKYARKNRGLESIHLNTNARYLTKEMSHKLLDCDIKEMLVSMDAITRETYDKIRVGGNFDETVRNIEYFLSAKKERGLERPRVIMQFIIMDENEHEVEAFKDFWLARGASVKVRLKMGWGNVINAEDLITANIKRNFPCPWILRGTAIHWNGRFSQCDADYEGLYSPGDFTKQTIKEVWNGELARRRERHWALDFSMSPCCTCNDWSVGRSTMLNPEDYKK